MPILDYSKEWEELKIKYGDPVGRFVIPAYMLTENQKVENNVPTQVACFKVSDNWDSVRCWAQFRVGGRWYPGEGKIYFIIMLLQAYESVKKQLPN